VRILSEVVNDLREQERSHRARFRDVKLIKSFDQVSYAFEKIFEEARQDSAPTLGSWAVGHLQQSVDAFAQLLAQRGLSVDLYDSIKHLYKDIAHPLVELRKFIFKEPSEILSNKSAVVFSEALQSYFEQLRHIAHEIDEEYASEPPTIVEPERTTVPVVVTITTVGN